MTSSWEWISLPSIMPQLNVESGELRLDPVMMMSSVSTGDRKKGKSKRFVNESSEDADERMSRIFGECGEHGTRGGD